MALLLAVAGAGCAPPSETELLAKAESAIAAGDEAAARIHLMNLLQRNEANVEARARLADLDLDAGNSGMAEAGYARAAKLRPDDAHIRAGLAQAIAQQDRRDEALEILQPDTVTTPAGRARLLGLRGVLLMQAGDLQGAHAALAEALALAPEDPDRIAEMAQLEARAGRGAEADRRIAQALALEPEHVRALLARGSRQSAQQQFTAAETTFRRATELATARHQRQARLAALLALGEVQLLQQRTEEAGRTIALLDGIAADAAPVRFLRASYAAQTGDDQKAIEELLAILSTSPENLPARRLLGLTYARNGQWNMAENHLGAVATASPDDSAVRQALAAVRARQETRIDDAVLTGIRRELPPAERKRSLTLAAAQELVYGRPMEALEYFRKAETEFPEDAELALGSALALLNSGQLDQAIAKLQADTGPETAAARNSLLITAYLRKGDQRQALDVAGQLAAQHPAQTWAHDLNAAALLAAGRSAEARTSLQRALAIDAADAFALAVLVPLEIEAGNLAAADALLARAPQDATQVQLLQAMVALQKGDVRAASRLGESVVRQDPRNADGHNILGLARLAGGAPAAAIGHYETARLLAPKVPVYALNLGTAYLAAGNPEAATAAAVQARALNADPDGLAELELRLLLAAREFAAAEKKLAAVTPQDPQSVRRLLLVAELRRAEGNPGAAADALSSAFARAPSKRLAMETALARQAAGRDDMIAPLLEWQQRAGADADILFTMGSIELAAGDRGDALKRFEEALKIEPAHVQALNNLAWLYNEAHDARAQELAERAYRAAPDDPHVLDTVGWVRLTAGNSRSALEALDKAASLAPDDPEIQYHRAEALIKNGQAAEARVILENLLRAPAEFPSRPAATEQLERLGRG